MTDCSQQRRQQHYLVITVTRSGFQRSSSICYSLDVRWVFPKRDPVPDVLEDPLHFAGEVMSRTAGYQVINHPLAQASVRYIPSDELGHFAQGDAGSL
jgi:hypothetical protein